MAADPDDLCPSPSNGKIEFMIRYTCEACGKALRANDEIIGRKAQCTRCGTIGRVPAASTRPSQKKAKNGNRSKRANSSSPASFVTEPPDSSKVGTKHVENSLEAIPPNTALISMSQPPLVRQPLSRLPQAVAKNEQFEPVFKRIETRKNVVPPLMLVLAGISLAVLTLAIGAFSLNRSDPPAVGSKFGQTEEVIQYRKSLFELKKSQRVLEVMADGYLAAKNLPESELGDLNEFVRAIDQFTEASVVIEEANALFEAGKIDEAKTLIQQEIATLKEFQQEASRRTREYQASTYQ